MRHSIYCKLVYANLQLYNQEFKISRHYAKWVRVLFITATLTSIDIANAIYI